jgi:ligand-binding SRPBCC domain-containing protein
LATIHLTTFIVAPVQRVFDLSRSVNLHKITAAQSGEQAVAGVVTGLMHLNETVTWQAKHLFKQRLLTVIITAMENPLYFCDEMTKGDFKAFKHEHYFKAVQNGVIMIDEVDFESPYGWLGRLFNKVYLTNYLRHFLLHRNEVIKLYAETDQWKQVLN